MKVSHYLFDRTNGSAPTQTEGYANRLSGGVNERFGVARSLSVMPGDKITAEVYAKYIDVDNADGNLAALITDIATQIASGATSSGIVIDGGSFSTSTSSFSFPGYAAQNTANSTGSSPRAFLNWLVFDRDYNFLPLKSGYKRIGVTSDPRETGQDVAHEHLFSPEITIDQAGYVYIFTSNEESTSIDVYFDDFKVTHIKSPAVQMDDYYPFGLTFNSYSRENAVSQNYKYNGKEEQNALDIGWYSYGARQYDSKLGRWTTCDPLADKYLPISPYVYVVNNPVNAIDPDGKRIYFVGGAGNDQIGWNYMEKWKRAFDTGGINGFRRINASHDDPVAVRNGAMPIGDIMFTASYRETGYLVKQSSRGGTSVPIGFEMGLIENDQVNNAVGQIHQDLANTPLGNGEQFNLMGYSYGSVLQAHVALKLANSGQKIHNVILVGSPISSNSRLFKQLSRHKNIGNVLRIDNPGDLLSDPKDILEFIEGARQNGDPTNSGEGPHFDLARPGQGEGDNNDTYKRILQVVVEWLKQNRVK